MAKRLDRRTFLLASVTGAGAAMFLGQAVNLGGSPDPPDHPVWRRIEAWMGAHAPEALEVLRPGADDDSIRAAEDVLGLDLPESFRRSVARHDGQEVQWPSLVELGFLMSLQHMVDEWRSLTEWYEERSDFAEGDAWWRPGLVPFVWRDGDYLCLDLHPPQGRARGEVWALVHDDEPPLSPVATDFGVWLERWADELEAGLFYLDRAPGAGLVPHDEEEQSLWPD